ncbi:UNVERIFIED_CONTAM: Ino80 [Trichonephila clavipes]
MLDNQAKPEVIAYGETYHIFDEIRKFAYAYKSMASKAETEASINNDHGLLAKPLHLQRLEQAVRLEPFLNYIENVYNESQSDNENIDEGSHSDFDLGSGIFKEKFNYKQGKEILSLYFDLAFLLYFIAKDILLSDSSDSDDSSESITEEDLHDMLKLHKYQKTAQTEFHNNPELRQFQYYGSGLLSNYDKFHDNQKLVLGGKKLKEKKAEKRKEELVIFYYKLADNQVISSFNKKKNVLDIHTILSTNASPDDMKTLALENANSAYKAHVSKLTVALQLQLCVPRKSSDDEYIRQSRKTIKILGLKPNPTELFPPSLTRLLQANSNQWAQLLVSIAHLPHGRPYLKVLPYWGNTTDRKVLRKFWSQTDLHTENASFHVLITSYQLVVQDVKYFQRIKWQYMVLDEAQAIKSTSSQRWKILLSFNCRNRLLLTGTPIQNSMAELWALLHFIMPTLFDSHDEFNEWFSKDIESHAENKTVIDEKHLSRLHKILQPFMLRRVKKDVENELSDKIEILVYCPLTRRQKLLYQNLRKKISIDDLMQSSSTVSSHSQSATSSLMNLVMQFRKVCNHPDLFEKREVKSPFFFKSLLYILPKLLYRQGLLFLNNFKNQHISHKMFGIFYPDHIHYNLFPGNAGESKCFF